MCETQLDVCGAPDIEITCIGKDGGCSGDRWTGISLLQMYDKFFPQALPSGMCINK